MSTARRALALAAVVPALAVVLTGCGGEDYDEAGHRAAYEALGHEVQDWDTVRELAQETCDLDEDRVVSRVTEWAEIGALDLLETDIEYVCPDREADFGGYIALARAGDFG